MQRLFKDIPVIFDDDPEQEEQREVAIWSLRREIAGRWIDILNRQKVLPPLEFQELVCTMRETLQSFMEIHGQEIPFPPEPVGLDISADQVVAVAEKKDSSQSTSSGSSKGALLPHAFRYLQNKDASVWTVLQARVPRIKRTLFIILLPMLCVPFG